MSAEDFQIKEFNGAPDIFSNKLDTTWMGFFPDGHDFSCTMPIIPVEHGGEDDGQVEYSYNKQGFRCDDFSSVHDGKHILFAGCSQSEGVGSPIDTVWTKLLANNLGATNFYSIARAGYGWQKIISNYTIYAESFGHPEYLFVLLPNVGRLFEWQEKENQWYYVQRYPNGELGKGPGERNGQILQEFSISKSDHRRLFIDFVAAWKMFEKYLESNGVKMIWASWDYKENNNYMRANFSKNYLHLTPESLQNYIMKARPNGKLEKHDMLRRDGHDGILIHEWWLESFKAEISRRGFFND